MSETLPRQSDLTPRQAVKLFIASFEHSQGDVSVQTGIFDYLAVFRPHWRMPDQMLEEIRRMAVPVISRIVSDGHIHRKIEERLIDIESTKPLNLMQYSLNRRPKQFTDKAWRHLSTTIIYCDWRNIVSKPSGREYGHRHSETSSTRYSVRTDPYFSYICHYALSNHSTGLEVLDCFYKEIEEFLRREARDLSDNDQSKLKSVIDVYSSHHPEFISGLEL